MKCARSREEWEKRRRGKPVNTWKFGNQIVKTGVYMVMPEPTERIDIHISDIVRRPRKEGSLERSDPGYAEVA